MQWNFPFQKNKDMNVKRLHRKRLWHVRTLKWWDTGDRPFVQVRIRQGYDVSEAQLKVLASQRVLSVVLDQRLQAGKVEVGREVKV